MDGLGDRPEGQQDRRRGCRRDRHSHSRHAAVQQLVGTVGLSKSGVPFDSLDGEPVYVFVLLVSPQDRPGDHLRALENVSRSLRNDHFVGELRQAKTRERVLQLLDGADEGGPG